MQVNHIIITQQYYIVGQELSAVAVVLTVWQFKPLLFCKGLTYAHIQYVNNVTCFNVHVSEHVQMHHGGKLLYITIFMQD